MKLPVLKSKEVLQKLKHAGYSIDHQTGSHIILLHPSTNRRVTVPYHNKDLKRKTVKSIVKQTGLSIVEFNNL